MLVDVDDLTGDLRAVVADLALVAELHRSGLQCEEGVVLADADVVACHDLSAALTDDDRTCFCRLSITDLHAEEFRL